MIVFEIIGIIVVCWIGFNILKVFFKVSSTVRSQEYEKETHHIVINELNTPDVYYSYLTTTNINGVKKAAKLLRNTNDEFKHISWSRLLAIVIYGEFHKDCTQWHLGNPTSQQLFYSLGVLPNIILKELERDGRQVMLWCARAGQDYGNASDNSIKDLILRCEESRDTHFHYPSLCYERMSDFIEKNRFSCEWFPNYKGMRFEYYDNSDDNSFLVYVEPIDSLKEDKSGVILCVY